MKTSEGTEARNPGDLGFLERIEADLSRNLVEHDNEGYLDQSNISELTKDDEELKIGENDSPKDSGLQLKELSKNNTDIDKEEDKQKEVGKSRFVESEDEDTGKKKSPSGKEDGEKKKKKRRRRKK